MDRAHCLNCSIASSSLTFWVFGAFLNYYFIIGLINALFHFHFNLEGLLSVYFYCWLPLIPAL